MHAHTHRIGIDRGRDKQLMSIIVVALLTLSLVFPGSLASAKPLATDRAYGRTSVELGLQLEAMPDVAMKAGMLVTDDGKVLWTREPDQRRAIASITKIMTAVIIMEQEDLGREVVIPRDVASVGYSSLYTRPGERVAIEHLMNAMLVRSGNDAATALAVHVAGSVDEFVAMMNDKASELGLKDTNFTNPHGLDAGDQYSTADDLAVLSRYAMTKPEFRRIVAQERVSVPTVAGTQVLEATNLLMGRYEGSTGVKTGWTDKAGYCVINSAQREGFELYAVVLGAANEAQRFKDARELLDWGFAHYRPQQLVSAGTVVAQAPVVDFLDVTVGAQVAEDRVESIFDIAGPVSRSVTVSAVKAPVRQGDRIGIATFTQGDQIIATVPLVASADVDAPGLFSRAAIAIIRTWRKFAGGQMTAPPVTAPAVS